MFFSVISLLGYTLFLSNKTTLPFCYCPLWVNASLIIFLYSVTFFGVLPITVQLLIAAGFCLFPSSFFCFIKKRENNEKGLLALFSIMLIFVCWYVNKMPFSVSDDYVYWGAASKYLFLKKQKFMS